MIRESVEDEVTVGGQGVQAGRGAGRTEAVADEFDHEAAEAGLHGRVGFERAGVGVDLGAATVDWKVFSLLIQNNEDGVAAVDPASAGVRGLRTAVLVRDTAGNDAAGAFYEALGNRHFHGDLEKYAVADYVLVSVSAFDALDIPLLQGRTFDRTDSPDQPHVAIVSESFANE